MYVVVATFVAQPGSEDAVAHSLATMTPHALAEPGCHAYFVNRSREDHREFLIYEQYRDEAAFNAHRETEPFRAIVLGEVVPLLDHRSRALFELITPVPADTVSAP